MSDDAPAVRVERQVALDTFRSIRLAFVLLVVLLAAAVLAQAVDAGCWETSISAYYWTAAHGVVVGMLCGVGVCLLVYKGSSPVEDAVLDVSGFLAFVVAMVPTDRGTTCGGPGLPPEYLAADGVRNNLLAVLVAGAVAQVVHLVLVRRGVLTHEPSRSAAWVRAIGWLVVVVGAVVFVTDPDRLLDAGHDVAALVMFAGVVLVAWLNARQAREARERAAYVTAYRVIGWAIGATLVVIGGLRWFVAPDWEHAVLVLEALLVVEFAAFWVVQTVELWHVTDRRELMRGEQGARGARRAPAATGG